jgi:hypothetical protein
MSYIGVIIEKEVKSMKKKIFVITAVVVAVMALGIGSALAFGGPGTDQTTTPFGRYSDCDETCDNVPLRPQDGTGNQYGARANNADCDGDCDLSGAGNCYGNGDCDGTCDGVPLRPQDGTGKQYGLRAGDSDNDGICDYGNAVGSGRGGQCGRFR